ncbi:IS110 family transposase [Streptomyces sp. NPDC095817]|uniref:IS110 family transposase n=1 Tax=Streptomyces sp. NPDC095817 TaxID=3155082 RepID=UPI0033296903
MRSSLSCVRWLRAACEPQGIGPITAAQFLVSWSHPGLFRTEAAFASFAGVSPIPASSGLTNRHRINRSGDRQLNRACTPSRSSACGLPPLQRRTSPAGLSEGETSRDAQRRLKRAVYRQLFKIFELSEVVFSRCFIPESAVWRAVSGRARI